MGGGTVGGPALGPLAAQKGVCAQAVVRYAALEGAPCEEHRAEELQRVAGEDAVKGHVLHRRRQVLH